MKPFLRSVLVATIAAVTLSMAGAATSTAAGQPTAPTRPASSAVAAGAFPASYQRFLASVGGSKFIDVHRVRMHYVEAGSKSRPVLLLLHGSPDNVYSWRNIMPTLARTYHVIAPDLIGFGQSGQPSGPLTWSSEISYLTGFIREKHLHHITMIATDVGGLFGFAYAQHHPGNVEGIALWETVTAPIASYELLGSYCPACVGFFQTPKNPAAARKYIIDNPDFASQVYSGPGLLHPLAPAVLAGYSYFLATPAQRRHIVEIGASMPIGGVPANNFDIARDFARYLRTSHTPKLVLYASPGSILPAATVNGLGFPAATYLSVGAGQHYLAEDEPAAITEKILTWRAHLPHPRPLLITDGEWENLA